MTPKSVFRSALTGQNRIGTLLSRSQDTGQIRRPPTETALLLAAAAIARSGKAESVEHAVAWRGVADKPGHYDRYDNADDNISHVGNPSG